MPQVGLKPTIPVFEQAKMVHALDCVATVIGLVIHVTKLHCVYILYRNNYGA
jgi:hypothetical protein